MNIPSCSSREFYAEEKIKTNYTTWIKRIITKYGFNNYFDYIIDKKQPKGGRPAFDWLFTDESMEVIKTGYRLSARILSANRLEEQFAEKIHATLLSIKSFKWLCERVIYQYSVEAEGAQYKIDIYYPEVRLAIEYDEPHHVSQQSKDHARQSALEKKLGCHFIRVKPESEAEGLGAIIDFFISRM